MTREEKISLAIIGGFILVGGITIAVIVVKNKKKQKRAEEEKARAEAEAAQYQQPSGGGANNSNTNTAVIDKSVPPTGAPNTFEAIKAFQQWKEDKYPPMAGGVDGIWGSNTYDAWIQYGAEYSIGDIKAGTKLYPKADRTVVYSYTEKDPKYSAGIVVRTREGYVRVKSASSKKGWYLVEALVVKNAVPMGSPQIKEVYVHIDDFSKTTTY